MTSMAGSVTVRLSYLVFYPSSGIDLRLNPVIFTHGINWSKESWGNIPQIVADRTRRKAYSVDVRNHGDSEWNCNSSLDLCVEDLVRLMESLGIPRAVLVGHSIGGIISLRLALKRPYMVEMLFIEDIYVKKLSQKTVDRIRKQLMLLEKVVQSIPRDCDEANAGAFMVEFIRRSVPSTSGGLTDLNASHFHFPLKRDSNGAYSFKTNLEVLFTLMKDVDKLMTEPVGTYEGPACFIYGTDSSFRVNEEEQHILRFFPNAELTGVVGARHCVHLKFPEEFTELVVKRILRQRNPANKNSLPITNKL